MHRKNMFNRGLFLVGTLIITCSAYAQETEMDNKIISECFGDVDIIVQIDKDNTGDSTFLADKFVKHGLATAISRDEYIDRTIFGDLRPNNLSVYCDDVSGDNCTIEDKSIYDEISKGCYGEMKKVLNAVSSDVR